MSAEEFDDVLQEAMQDVPEQFVNAHMDNIALLVEAEAPDHSPNILGLYHGIPITERGAWDFLPPDEIFLFRNNLVAFARDREHLKREIVITIVHEIAHHFGIDDERLHELGWG